MLGSLLIPNLAIPLVNDLNEHPSVNNKHITRTAADPVVPKPVDP
jgi:hypothetical protein